MLVYAVTSQKGGVGKTTTTANLGAALAEGGKRVLLLDLDPQGSLTAAVGRRPGGVTASDVLLTPECIAEAITPCTGRMHVVAATARLANVYIALDEEPGAPFRLASSLERVAALYDYCLLDCPPSLSHATTNALTAAHVALVPLQCEFLSLRGLADAQEIAAAVQESTNRVLRVRIVATMYDKRTIHSQDVLREARGALPGMVYETVIPRTIRLAEAPAVGQSILEYAPESNGAYAYRSLAREVLEEDATYATPRRHPGRDAESAGLRQRA
ncbi:MAG: ParA family protein [Chthonomonadales bacterium]|nr:ParA family protein [Chthonomonadales bacterium]